MDLKIQEILDIIAQTESIEELHDSLSHYHSHDIAEVFEFLSEQDLNKIYQCFAEQELSDIFSYIEDAGEYLNDLNKEKAADLIELMDSDDALKILEDLEESERQEIIELIDEEIREDIELIENYEDDQIGSYMTNNYITINRNSTIKKAMRTVVNEASNNDNFTILYVINDDETLYGTIELKDLIKARANEELEDIIKKSYPAILDTAVVSDVLIEIKEYDMDSIPVVDKNNKFLGVITSNDLIEVIDDELSDDYAKLAGLSGEEELDESTFKSVKKRIPWLCILLVLGLIISLVMQVFEAAIVAVPVIVFFQSMILGMGGNVGTQSLAVTIRAISDDEISRKDVARLVFKEIRIAFFNGLLISIVAFIVVTLYLVISKTVINEVHGFYMKDIYKTAGVVAVSLLLTMVISGLIGTVTPIVLKKCKIDPAVASGPFITSINDITAIVIYYSIALIMFSNLM